MRTRAALHKPAEPVSGEEFPFLGRKLMLAVSERAKRIEVVGDTLAFPKVWLPKAEQRLRRWYCGQAAAILDERLAYWRGQTGIRFAAVRLSDARKRWGSCSSKGSLNFSWRLVMAPVDVIDYVVVHELVHIEHMNHSKAFWSRVGEILPDYEVKKKWLRDNSGLLGLL
jgi:predicted metal-dependent hydrolase